MTNKNTYFEKIKKSLEKRKEDVIERQPHDSEFESGAESLEADLLRTISCYLFSEILQPIEKTSIGETIQCLKSITKILETDGKKTELRDCNHEIVFAEELDAFNIEYVLCENQEDIDDNSDEDLDDEDLDDEIYSDYCYVDVTTTNSEKIKIKLLSFFYMYGNDVDDYLYQWTFKNKEYKTHNIKEVISFILKN